MLVFSCAFLSASLNTACPLIRGGQLFCDRVLDFKIADLAQDSSILHAAREAAKRILKEDPSLTLADHLPIQDQLVRIRNHTIDWGSVG